MDQLKRVARLLIVFNKSDREKPDSLTKNSEQGLWSACTCSACGGLLVGVSVEKNNSFNKVKYGNGCDSSAEMEDVMRRLFFEEVY